jgi:predicted transposase YdaD
VRRDSIYYQIFKRFPLLLFQLVDAPPAQARHYRFESVEVKGEWLYHRFFTELFRAEVEAMLGVRLEETRVYQEAKAERRVKGELLGQLKMVPLLLEMGMTV